MDEKTDLVHFSSSSSSSWSSLLTTYLCHALSCPISNNTLTSIYDIPLIRKRITFFLLSETLYIVFLLMTSFLSKCNLVISVGSCKLFLQ